MKTEKKPKTGPGEIPGSAVKGKSEMSMPIEIPPATIGSKESPEAPAPSMAGIGDAGPSMQLMQGVAGIAAWVNNKQITSLWSLNQNRNSWVGISGIGWRKLANNSDSAIMALTILSAHAREKGSVVNYREENDGMIHEMYVW